MSAARRACDRAAKACAKAHEALQLLGEFIPSEQSDRYRQWVRDLGEYAEYLETATWPDQKEQK